MEFLYEEFLEMPLRLIAYGNALRGLLIADVFFYLVAASIQTRFPCFLILLFTSAAFVISAVQFRNLG